MRDPYFTRERNIYLSGQIRTCQNVLNAGEHIKICELWTTLYLSIQNFEIHRMVKSNLSLAVEILRYLGSKFWGLAVEIPYGGQNTSNSI